MIVSLDATTGTVHKQATTAEESERLEREAATLAMAPHPGLVQLRSTRPGTLEVCAITGWCLSDIGNLAPSEVAGLGCAVATILADLHDLGIAHGAVEADHVLVGTDGRPVLCSLGHARLRDAEGGPAPEEDVTALIQMLDSLLPPDEPRAQAEPDGCPDRPEVALSRDGVVGVLWARRPLGWTSGSRAGRPVRRPVPSARQLAARLAALPGARLPDPSRHSAAGPRSVTAGPTATPAVPGPVRSLGKRWPWLVGVAGAIAAAGVTWGTFAAGVGRGVHPPAPAPRIACPQVDQGCGPIDHPGGVVETKLGRFAVANGSDPLVLGRWTCGPALPAVLRLDHAEVWIWDRWPTAGTAVVARLEGHFADAMTLRVVADASGCDRLMVIGRDGRSTTIPANIS